MSLRGFHIVFITVTTLLSVFLALWGLRWAPADAESMANAVAIVGVAGAIGFPIYGIYFYRKAKKLIL
jgi:hypothetical protein